MTTSGGSAVRATLSRWARAVADVPRWIWFAAAAAVALLLVIAATGGFAHAQTEPAAAGSGDEVRTSTYAVTVLNAEFTEAVESEYLEADEGEKLLVMTLDMENLSDVPIGVGTTADLMQSGLVNTATPLLDLNGVDETGGVSAWRADGSAGQVILQPGVPSEVTIAWTIPEDAFPDGTVSLDVYEPDIHAGAIIISSNAVTWRPDELVARINVPATEAP